MALQSEILLRTLPSLLRELLCPAPPWSYGCLSCFQFYHLWVTDELTSHEPSLCRFLHVISTFGPKTAQDFLEGCSNPLFCLLKTLVNSSLFHIFLLNPRVNLAYMGVFWLPQPLLPESFEASH